MGRLGRIVAGVCVGVVLVSALVQAQGSTAQINGTVHDDSGAVLPGATVTATQTDTGFQRSTTTAADGEYALPNTARKGRLFALAGPWRLRLSLIAGEGAVMAPQGGYRA